MINGGDTYWLCDDHAEPGVAPLLHAETCIHAQTSLCRADHSQLTRSSEAR